VVAKQKAPASATNATEASHEGTQEMTNTNVSQEQTQVKALNVIEAEVSASDWTGCYNCGRSNDSIGEIQIGYCEDCQEIKHGIVWRDDWKSWLVYIDTKPMVNAICSDYDDALRLAQGQLKVWKEMQARKNGKSEQKTDLQIAREARATHSDKTPGVYFKKTSSVIWVGVVEDGAIEWKRSRYAHVPESTEPI